MFYKTQELVDIYNKLSQIGNKVTLPAKSAYKMLRNIRLIKPIVEDYYTVQLNIAQSYGDLVNPELGTYKIKPENMELAQKELRELGETENDICFLLIDIDDLDGLNLSIEEMDALYPMIKSEGA